MQNKKYQIIYADPPWKYNDKMVMKGVHGNIRGAECFYKTMSLNDIKALQVKNICDDNCVLFLWITMPFLNKAEEVMNAWGFKYKTCGFTWIKKTKEGKIHMGMGHHTRGNAELCLRGQRGKLQVLDHSVHQVIEGQIMRHSEKPDDARKRIVRLYGDLPRIELFARQKTEGWDVWGNEVESDIIL